WLELPAITYYRGLTLLRWPLKQFDWPWYLPALIFAATFFTIVLLGMALVTRELFLILGPASLVFVASFALGACFVTIPADVELVRRLTSLQRTRAARLANRVSYRQSLEKAQQDYHKLSKARAVRAACEEAEARYQQLCRDFNDRRNQLKLRDWRGTRGIHFES